MRAYLRNIYYHIGIIYDYLTHYKRGTLRVILRRLTEAQTIVIIHAHIPCILGGFCYYVYIGFCSHQDRKEEHPLRKGRLNSSRRKSKRREALPSREKKTMVANHHVNRLAMFHVEHKHIFKMWKWSPHVDHALMGD